MSELTARIRAFQKVVREALDQDLSLEGDANLAEVLEVLRFVVREQDRGARDKSAVAADAEKPMRTSAARTRRRRSAQGDGGADQP
jgi:hypothetical protein